MANEHFNEFRLAIENSIKSAAVRAVHGVKLEEYRLKVTGAKIAGPIEKRIRAFRAARAAYKAVIETH